MMIKVSPAALAVTTALLLPLFLCACKAAPEAKGTVLPDVRTAVPVPTERAEIERLIVLGTPSALESAVEALAKPKTLGETDVLAYRYIVGEIAKTVYPEITGSLPSMDDVPAGHPLVRKLIDSRNGRFEAMRPEAGALEELLPALAIFRLQTSNVSTVTLSAVERLKRFNVPSALADLCKAIVHERTRNFALAMASFDASLAAGPDCYPAALGKARSLMELGRSAEALDVLDTIPEAVRAGKDFQGTRATALYKAGRYAEAGSIVARILQDDPFNSRFMLMRAHILVEDGQYKQATSLLDAYGNVDPNNRLYILLRARTASESSHNREEAVSAIRRGLERYPDDTEIALYAARLLSQGSDTERSEAVILAGRVLTANPDSHEAMSVLLAADLERRDWLAAADRVDAIRSRYGDFADYKAMYQAYRNSGRMADAASVAGAWRGKSPDSEDASVAYIASLVDMGSRKEAADLILRGLSGKGSPRYRSSLYWLQSLLSPTDDARLAALRSSLIENGMNADSLKAMCDLYMKKADYQKARFYLKQALSASPFDGDLVAKRDELMKLGVAFP